MEYLPAFLQLRGAPALLIGGGVVASRKASLLLRAGARLTVIAPEIEAPLQKRLAEEGGQWLQRRFQDGDTRGYKLVIAATPDQTVNGRVSQEAQAADLPVNVVDNPSLCTFIFPSVVDRSPIVVAISSAGRSPVLTRMLRSRIEAMVPSAYGKLAEFAGSMRDAVKAALDTESARRRFWEETLAGPVASEVMSGREDQARERFLQELLAASEAGQGRGEVYLIGAGPGDPDLMTFKGIRLLQAADVVLHDRLVSDEIVDLARRDAERIYVGKARSDHAVPQPEINQMLVDLAREGKIVARLKGGDPFVFGRGGEEIALLAEHRIPFQVVPGITAATGAAAYGGIPLTHRDHAQSVRFVAGYLKGDRVDHPWEQFLSENETLVFYMGLAGLPLICEQLLAHGRRAETPVALVERATQPGQRVVVGTLADIQERVARIQPRAPTLVIVGNVVSLSESLAWFGQGIEG